MQNSLRGTLRSVLYTYQAEVVKIIDGDTITVNIDLGFHTISNQKLRLRGINAFELSTKEGKLAKDFVESRLNDLEYIVIKTYHRDKYSRYLADIFYSDSENDIVSILNNGHFLNQDLLDNKLAYKYYCY